MFTKSSSLVLISFLLLHQYVSGSGLADTAASQSLLSFTSSLKQQGLYDPINSNYVVNTTLFGPTDVAFSSFMSSTQGIYLRNSAAWSDHLTTLLWFHLVMGAYNESEIFDGARANLTTFAAKGTLDISINQGFKTLEPPQDAAIQQADILADGNNILQIVNKVLLPANMSMTFWEQLELVNIPQRPGKKAKFNTEEGYSIHVYLLNSTGLDQTLYSTTSTNGTTVFVPPNTVYLNFFQRFFLGALLADGNTEFATQYLQYHALDWNFYNSSFAKYGSQFHTRSLLGPSVWITYQNNSMFFNDARVFAQDQFAANGVSQLVSWYYQPPDVRQLLNYTTRSTPHQFGELFGILLQYNTSIGDIGNSLGGTGGTLFAPVDGAFFSAFDHQTLLRLLDPTWHMHLEALLNSLIAPGSLMASDLLARAPFSLTMANNHSMEITKSTDMTGQEVLLFGGIQVFLSDLVGLDGVFHGIDQINVPTELTRSLWDVLESDPDWSTFVKNIDQFGLGSNISDTFPLTIFAPINSAWSSPNIVPSLLGDLVEGQIIQQLYTTDQLLPGTVLQATNGYLLNITKDETGNLLVNGAKIIQGNYLGNNGVIHKIDKVILDYNAAAPPPVTAPTLQPVSPYPTPTLAVPSSPFYLQGFNSTCDQRSGSGCQPSRANQTVLHFRATPTPTATSSANSPTHILYPTTMKITLLSTALSVMMAMLI